MSAFASARAGRERGAAAPAAVPASVPAPLSPLLRLQQQVGNAEVQRMLAGGKGVRRAGDEAVLDLEMARDAERVRELLESTFYTDAVEAEVIAVLRRWADEHGGAAAGPDGRSAYLDRFFTLLRTRTLDTGTVVTRISSLYDLILTRFDRADEVRALRDARSRSFVGEEPLGQPSWLGTGEDDFLGSIWADVKSGDVAERIGEYLLGLADAGIGMVEGVHLLLTQPEKVIEGIGRLPQTVTVLWRNRERLWGEFAGAPPARQARMIGRIFGELELVIATAGAGGGARPLTMPMTAPALVPAGRGAAALARGGEITIPVAKLGEGGRMTSLMAMTAEGSAEGKKTADELPTDGPAVPGAAAAPPGGASRAPAPGTFAPGELEKMGWAERQGRIAEFMRANHITRIIRNAKHHAWPEYLGGPAAQKLYNIEERLHILFHSGLDELLPRRSGSAHYQGLSRARRVDAMETLARYTRDFDAFNRTRIYEFLKEAVKGTEWERLVP